MLIKFCIHFLNFKLIATSSEQVKKACQKSETLELFTLHLSFKFPCFSPVPGIVFYTAFIRSELQVCRGYLCMHEVSPESFSLKKQFLQSMQRSTEPQVKKGRQEIDEFSHFPLPPQLTIPLLSDWRAGHVQLAGLMATSLRVVQLSPLKQYM